MEMEVHFSSEVEHHCKLVEWDSVSILGCTPIQYNRTETEFNMEEHDREVRKDLVEKMKSRFFHMVGTEFDNAIIEMERLTDTLK